MSSRRNVGKTCSPPVDRKGYESGLKLFNRHLDKVNEICRKNGLAPIIWSDMYFRLGNAGVATRLEEMRRLILDLLRGKISRIEELDAALEVRTCGKELPPNIYSVSVLL